MHPEIKQWIEELRNTLKIKKRRKKNGIQKKGKQEQIPLPFPPHRRFCENEPGKKNH